MIRIRWYIFFQDTLTYLVIYLCIGGCVYLLLVDSNADANTYILYIFFFTWYVVFRIVWFRHWQHFSRVLYTSFICIKNGMCFTNRYSLRKRRFFSPPHRSITVYRNTQKYLSTGYLMCSSSQLSYTLLRIGYGRDMTHGYDR